MRFCDWNMRGFLFLTKVLCLACFLFLAGSAYGQDLGSSNKLFGGGSKSAGTSSKKAVKNVVVKPRPAAPKANVVAKKPAGAKTTAVPKNTSAAKPVVKNSRPSSSNNVGKTKSKPKFTEFQEARPTTLTITPTQPKPTPVISNNSTAVRTAPNTATTAAANDQFEDLIEQGNIARDDRNYAAAEAVYKRAKTVKPRDSRAAYGLGNLYSDQQRWEEAETAYRTALQLDSGSAIAHIALSYVLTQPLAVTNLSDRYEEAEKLARKAIQQAPSNALAFDQLGVALELRGLIAEETENAYRKSIQLDPSFAPAYAHLGRLLRRRGLAKESAAAYQNAIERSTDVAMKVLVADVMQSEQRYAESEKLLRKALDSDPKNQSALLLMGRALTTMGNFGDAEKVLRTSLESSSNGFMANSLLGNLFVRQGKYESAENVLLQALLSVSALEKRRLAQQFEFVGDGYLKSGKARNAERSYRQAMLLDSENESLAGKLAKAQRS